jgi:CHAT domain-containing protein
MAIALPSIATDRPIQPWRKASANPPALSQSATDTAFLLHQGKQRYESGQFAEAAELWQQAVISSQIINSQNDRLNHAISLNYLSLAQQALGKWDAASQAIDSSLTLLQSNLSPEAKLPEAKLILAQALNTQGSLQFARGQTETALEIWQRAERTYTELGDRFGTWGSQLNQAQALQALGLFQKAQALLEQVNQQLQAQPSALAAATLRSLGSLWQEMGNLSAAQNVLQQSLAIAQQLHLPAEISAVQINLGNTRRVLNQPEAALQSYQQAAEIAPGAIARLEAQVNQLSLLLDLKRQSAAQELIEQIQPQLDLLTPSRKGIYIQVNFAISWGKFLASNAPQRSQPQHNHLLPVARHLTTALQQARTLRDSRAESYVLGELAALYEQTHQWQEAQQLTQQALLIAQSLNAPEITYRWQWQLGRLQKQQGDRSSAIAAYTDAMHLLKSLRSDLVTNNQNVQFSFQDKIEPIYRELINLLVEGDRLSQADLKQAREVIEALQLAELNNFFRSACLDAHPSQIDQVDPTAAVLYPIVLVERLTVILSLPEQPLTAYSSPISRQQVETVSENMLESLNPLFADSERLRLSQQMYEWLIRPAETALKQSDIKTLVFVLDGSLRNLPLAALFDGKQYLVEQYSIAITPGLQLLEPRSLTSKQRLEVLIGGITEARQGFVALPGVAQESDQIASELTANVLLNQKFTYRNLQHQAQETAFPLVHLATHGQFSSESSDTFLLTWDDRLTIEELRELLRSRAESNAAPIELLVLSACQTAEGDQRATLGLAGLAVRSGARSTLATLWSVNDESTAKLMVQFYQALTQPGLNKSQALRQAQLALLKNSQYAHPYYWAPFILVGNWL